MSGIASTEIVQNPPATVAADGLRHDWRRDEIDALFHLPFADLIFRAQGEHRRFFDANEVQMSTLLSIKTGGCPEDCGYCPQSAKFDTGLKASKLMQVGAVLAEARKAKDAGASRYCMGAAWRSPKDHDLDTVIEMIQGVKSMGMETCVTLGMLDADQAQRLKRAGLDYYNHNLDTSPEYYSEIITTRTYQDRLDTLANVRDAGINVCCGGIVGMGEDLDDRVGLLQTLANLPSHPESVPINLLVKVEGTELDQAAPLDPFEFVRTIAVAKIPDARLDDPPVGRARAYVGRDAVPVLPGRRQFDLHRRKAADHRQPGKGEGPASFRPSGRAAHAAGLRGGGPGGRVSPCPTARPAGTGPGSTISGYPIPR